MNLMHSRAPRLFTAALAALLLLPLAVGSAFAQDQSDRAERLAQSLALTDAQTELVNRALADAAPGALWQLSADLAPTLSDEQKEKLFARPDRSARAEKGERGARTERGAKERRADRTRGERPDSTARAERREAMQARHEASRDAMRAALGLSAEQVQRLDALRQQHQAERQQRRAERGQAGAERPERGERAAELAEILTPQQEEVLKVHRALAMRLGPHRSMHGARR